ncbi:MULTISPECIES: ABC transporter ATP-binding protein [unclassified Microbacterium]|uniref:ABC transporter ATP-binding protein n=1 Tax=unclassified Microbacterium TaxID=2609290 RepID=UPI00214B86D3|nr:MULTISPECIES: ABC transporter ATP-binding protein [unclassified Microbacterium]MCR2809516.1 ABC transporter ATP-binding protein [Microbacterium sp. zg.B185]WIM20650.1 ABC transporter ATP-binding protein [Microbacterium sp. zg-B185]
MRTPTADRTTPAIETSGLHKRYGTRTAVQSLDLTIPAGSVFGLIGPNGAGKTTTLRMLLDIIRPTAGIARVLGSDPRRGGPALRRRIGFVPGDLRLEGRVTGRRLLEFYAEVSGPVAAGAIEEFADRLGAELNRPVHTLSKGNKQKLGLVQAFMHRPELLVLDEPTSGLDPLVQREFLQMLREARAAGQTVLLSSHVLSEIQQAADAVAVLSGGRVVASGDVASLRLAAVRRLRVGLVDAEPARIEQELAELSQVGEVHVISGPDGSVRVTATVAGDINPVVGMLARHRIADLAVEEPDLEESVLRLYGAHTTGAPDA